MDWVRKSITRTIGLAILLFILFLFLVYYTLLNVQFQDYFEQEGKESLIMDSRQISTGIEVFFQKYSVIVEQAKNNPDFIQLAKELKNRSSKRENVLYTRVTNELKDMYSMDNNIALAYLGIEGTGDIITNFYDFDIDQDYNVSNREWYQQTIESGGTILSPPYRDLVSGEIAVTIATPLKEQGKVLGAVSLDLKIKDINKMMDTYEVGKNGYAVLVYKDGQVLYHPNYPNRGISSSESLALNTFLQTMSEEISLRESGITGYSYQGVEKFIAYLPVDGTDLMVFTVIPKSEVYQQLNKFKVTNVVILAGLLLTTMVFLVFFERYISLPVVKMTRQIEAYSAREKLLLLPQKYLKRKDEIGILSRGLTFMLQRNSSYFLEIEEKNEQLQLAQEKISKERSLFKTTLHSLGDGVISTDNEGRITTMNPVAEQLTGWSMEEAVGKNFNDFFYIINEHTRERCDSPVEKTLHIGQIVQLEEHTMLLRKNGEEIPIEDSAAPIKDEDGNITGAVIVFRDFIEKKQKQEQILYLSYHDQLTGLYNRRFFEEQLKQMDTEDKMPFSLAMVDVNGLKLTNDAFGHKMGDDLLVRVATILEEECTARGVVARIGGDEFILLLPHTTSQETEALVQRIYQRVDHESFHNIVISISVGYDTRRGKEKSFDELFTIAEEHMYSRKITESQSMRYKTIQVIQESLNDKNETEKIHAERVSKICREIGEMLALDKETVKELEFVGLVHDIGKITIGEGILTKAGSLTESEYNEVRKHPESGYQILRSVDAYMSFAENVLYHHERVDGKGYPRGLKGEEIPLVARILAIADAYEAMTADRPYKKAVSREEAAAELRRNAGIQFDAQIVAVFTENVLRDQTIG